MSATPSTPATPNNPELGVDALAERRAVLLKELRALEATYRHGLDLDPAMRGLLARSILRGRTELSDVDAAISASRGEKSE
jgi:hypothetical protein